MWPQPIRIHHLDLGSQGDTSSDQKHNLCRVFCNFSYNFKQKMVIFKIYDYWIQSCLPKNILPGNAFLHLTYICEGPTESPALCWVRGPSRTRVILSHNCGSEVVCIDLGQHYHGSRRKRNVGVFDFISESNWQETNGLSVLVAELFSFLTKGNLGQDTQ